MGLHHRYYADDLKDAPWPAAYFEIQKQIGKLLREEYQPPKGLPHQLLALLIELNEQDKAAYS